MNHLFLGTKGLNFKEIRKNEYVIEDVLGVCSLPYKVGKLSELITSSYKIAQAIPLITKDGSLFLESELDSDYWFELEKYYVARLCDYYRIWQCGISSYMKYDHLIYYTSLGYSECGYGSGSKEILEFIHQETLNSIKDSKSMVTEDFLNLRLKHLQLMRICSDLLSVLHRAIYSFKELLYYQRKAIQTQAWAIERLQTNEVIHTGQTSYDIATYATIAVISLCTSLDLSSQLVYFFNDSVTPVDKFKPSQGKHFSDLDKIRENVLSNNELSLIKDIWIKFPSIKSLIQFRHDLVHNTTALELEKLYVGKGTEEICSLPMHYSFQPWRDCHANGQPLRYLGREYFVSNGFDFERQLCNWLTDVIQGHLAVGKNLLGY
jgi:hypothetical protein